MKKLSILIVIVLVLAAIIVPQVLFVVDETQLALVTRFGAPQLPAKTNPGVYIKTPFVEKVTYFEKRLLLFDAPPEDLLTSDKKRLRIDVYARGRIVDPLKFFQTVITQDRARSRAIDIIASELRSEIALDPQSDIIKTTREDIMNRVRDRVIPQLAEFGIEVIDVRIKRADFPDEIADSIYARMRAERVRIANRERAEGQEVDLEKRATVDRMAIEITSSAQKEADIIKGEAEADAVRIFAEALEEDPEFYTFQRTLEAYKKFLTQNATVVLPAGSELFQFLQSPGQVTPESSID
ncbi:MAG: protease modulator HflC [SAR202 cluster bacterium]|nr:protease modulator HflC [SAR202 cluster bacterium]